MSSSGLQRVWGLGFRISGLGFLFPECVAEGFPFARVRNRSRCVGFAGATTIVGKRRTVHFLRFALEKCQQSQGSGGPGRETQNCRHFWTRLASLRVKSVNSHKDRGGPGRETQNCRHFWTRLVSSRLKSVHSHRDRGVVAKPRTVVTFGLVLLLRELDCSFVLMIRPADGSINMSYSGRASSRMNCSLISSYPVAHT